MKRFEIVTLCLAALCGIVAAPVAAEEGKSFKIGEKYELTAPANRFTSSTSKGPKIGRASCRERVCRSV